MKTKNHHYTEHMKTLSRLFCILILTLAAVSARAQGTAISYNGFLTDQGGPAHGTYDLHFTVFNALTGPAQQGSAVDVPDLVITDGLFTVTLDFGAGVFTGAARWLEIGVRPGASTGPFTSVVPRQKFTATPYAITAGNLTGMLPASQLNGTLPSSVLGGTYSGAVTLNNAANSFTGNGSGLANVNATTLGGLAAANYIYSGVEKDGRQIGLLQNNAAFGFELH
jgi:hypothetical protein